MLNSKVMVARRARKKVSAFSFQPSAFACSGFTMVEIAISLAVIGIALVSIIGVLPHGMRTQQDNREETIVNQDATMLLEAIRGGARGLDDLTNYVFAITNDWTNVTTHVGGHNGYTFAGFSVDPGYYYPPVKGTRMTNGQNIIGLLSTPQCTDAGGRPVPDLLNGGYSNRVVAYVRSLSGPAGEKPPQDNDLLRGDSFSYRVLCVNAPVAGYVPPLWQAKPYNAGDLVAYILNGQTTCWQATAAILAGYPAPGDPNAPLWRWIPYPQQLNANLRELRLTFAWPLLPNGSVPSDSKRQTFRTMVAGQLAWHARYTNLFFYQPQTFAPAAN
jgi:prepilin-type N-terminal cleavage/methylation domain-containing protein